METFSEFIRNFCIVAVAGGMALLISPEGSTKKYVKFIISLCMVGALLSAFFTFAEGAEQMLSEMEIQTESDAEKTAADIQSAVVREARRNLETELCSLLCSYMDVNKNDIYIVVKVDCGEASAVEITEINVFLADMGKSETAKAYLTETFHGAVRINVMQKGE
jgi:hypothetical protein